MAKKKVHKPAPFQPSKKDWTTLFKAVENFLENAREERRRDKTLRPNRFKNQEGHFEDRLSRWFAGRFLFKSGFQIPHRRIAEELHVQESTIEKWAGWSLREFRLQVLAIENNAKNIKRISPISRETVRDFLFEINRRKERGEPFQTQEEARHWISRKSGKKRGLINRETWRRIRDEFKLHKFFPRTREIGRF